MAKFNRNANRNDEIEEMDDDLSNDTIEEDDEYDDDYDTPKVVLFGIGIPKKIFISSCLAVGVIVVAGVVFFSLNPHSDKSADVSSSSETTQSVASESTETAVDVPKDSEKSSVEPKGSDEKTATDSLERADAPLSGDESKQIGEALKTSLDKLKAAGREAKNDNAMGLSLTDTGVFNAVHNLLDLGYAPDIATVKGYKSDSDNVQQFTINLTKEGESPITLTGNWVPSIHQLGIVQFHGKIPDFGSISTNPQVDNDAVKNDTDKPEDWR